MKFSSILKSILFVGILLLSYQATQAQVSPTEAVPTSRKRVTEKSLSPLTATKLPSNIQNNSLLNAHQQQEKKEAADQATAQEHAAKEQSNGDGRISRNEATILSRFGKFREMLNR